MPVSFQTYPQQRHLNIVRTGAFCIDDLVDSVDRMKHMDIWDYSVLVDARDATTTLTAAEAQQLVSRVNSIGKGNERGPIAVVTGDDITYGMVRVFAAWAALSGMRVEVFRQMIDAEQWLERNRMPRRRPES